MDVVQKVKDLSNLAFDERSVSKEERLQAAIAALRLVEAYLLPKGKKKKIDVAADIAAKIMNPDFMEGVAVGVERVASSFDRVLDSAKRVIDRLGVEEAPSRSKKRRYGGR
jgi:hypothetical protein